MDINERNKGDAAPRFKNTALVTDAEGNIIEEIEVEPGRTYNKTPVYKQDDGTWTNDPLKVAKYSLTEDGAIKLTAPKELFETPEFNTIFDSDTLKSYSAAYRSNPAYRVPYTKRNEDGTTEEVQLTIPEFVDELNTALGNFIDNYKIAQKNKANLVKQYGENANKFSLTQMSLIAGSNADANRVLIPNFVFDSDNSFSVLQSQLDSDGSADVNDFMKVYKLGVTSQKELVGLMSEIEGYLANENWGESEEKTEEAVKALALKNFILSKDPDAEWYDSLGAGAATLAANAAEGFARVFINLGVFAEGVATFGQVHLIENGMENLDKAMSDWNQERMLIQDSTATLSTLGQIGGMIVGTIVEAYLTGKATTALKNAYATQAGKTVTTAQNMLASTGQVTGEAAYFALTPQTMVEIAGSYEQLSLGAKFVIKTLPIAQRVAMAASTAKAFMGGHWITNRATAFLLDTIHDAIAYDAVTLRHVIEGDSDQNVKNYWLGQLEDNAKWWILTGGIKSGFRVGKDILSGNNLPGALNAKATTKIQGLIAKVGDYKKQLKDSVYGGDFIRHMEEIHDSLQDGAKKDRLAKKIDIAKGEEVLRNERRALANLDLEWDGFKLTEESMSDFRKGLNNIKVWENAIDARAAGVTNKVQEMVGQVVDPSTGRVVYVNPSLGTVNAKAGNLYGRMMGYTDKYRLQKAPGSNLSQDIIDYLGGTAEKIRKTPIALGDGPNAAAAGENIEIIERNLKAIEDRLPDEVKAFVKNEETINSYFDFYRELRNYQDAKNIVDRGLLASFRGEGGETTDKYMPVVKAKDETDLLITRKSGRAPRIVDEDFDEWTFTVKEGQHYVDPEIVRQRALWQTAEAEISQNLLKAYNDMSSATVVERADGAVSQRARELDMKKGDIEKAISVHAKNYTQNWDLDTRAPETKRKILKNLKWDETERQEVAAMLSMDDTTQILQRYGVLQGGNARLTNLVNASNYEEWFDSQSESVKRYLYGEYSKYSYAEIGAQSQTGTYDLFKKALQGGGDDFEAGLQRAYLIGDEKFGSRGLMTQLVNDLMNGKELFGDGYIKLEARQALRNVLKLDTDNFVDSLYDSVMRATDDYLVGVMDDPTVKKGIDAITESGANGAELSAKYTALKYLTDDGKKELEKVIEKQVRADLKGKGLKSDDVDLCVKRAQIMANEQIKADFNDTRNALKTINGELVDDKDMFKEVRKLHDQIYGSNGSDKNSLDYQARKDLSSNVIVYRDNLGREVYAEVDPNFASLYKMRYQMSRGEASALAKFNAATSKLFRYGTTTLNLSSFSNQLFRDTGNALIVGGAWDTIKHNAENMRDVLGDDIVEQIRRFEPDYEMKQLEKYAEDNKMSLREAAVSRELARGAALSPASTETTLYKNVMREGGVGSDGIIANMNHKIKGILNKFESVDQWTNGRREEYLRNRVYANNLNLALTQGYTLQQARSFATFAMNNATTNFTRQIYHLQAIADSTPYFRAAINGTKSFWRMWSVDPVGITGRMTGGLILPVIFLTGASLGDPENKEVYKNIPEYQKDENLVFVVDKQIITIPIPQEMSNIVAPFRQFVEHLYYTDQNSFWELMMNDALGFSPVDLTGFSTIDMDKISQEPTIGDRLSRGFARIFSQMAPVPVRSTYMMVTGTDPYTGKNLYDPAYTYWDDDTSSVQTMNDYQNAFAKWVAKLWGKESNATVLEKVTSSIFGSTTTNFLGELVTLIEEGPEAAGGQIAKDVIEQATNPYYANAYNQADAAWKRAVRGLTAEKEQLVNSDEFKTIYSELSQTTDESKRKKLSAAGQNLISEYQGKVLNTVKRLSSVYKGTYDRKKLAATIQLLNFNTEPIYQTGTQYSSNIASESFFEGREAAISTLQAMGVTGTSDMSIFGYLVTDDSGNSVMKYTSPVAIMDMKNAWMGAGDIDQANIEAKLKTDGIKTSDMWNGYYEAKSKGSAALKQYKSEWNAKVVKSLAPYISERGVDSVMKSTATREILDNYLFIDNPYQTKAYLKKIFENE